MLQTITKCLVAEKCKLCKIYKRKCYVYGEACSSQKRTKKKLYKWAKHGFATMNPSQKDN